MRKAWKAEREAKPKASAPSKRELPPAVEYRVQPPVPADKASPVPDDPTDRIAEIMAKLSAGKMKLPKPLR